jgi:hypothetical protein
MAAPSAYSLWSISDDTTRPRLLPGIQQSWLDCCSGPSSYHWSSSYVEWGNDESHAVVQWGSLCSELYVAPCMVEPQTAVRRADITTFWTNAGGHHAYGIVGGESIGQKQGVYPYVLIFFVCQNDFLLVLPYSIHYELAQELKFGDLIH